MLALAIVLGCAPAAAAVTITEYPIEAGAATGVHAPAYIASAPDGTLWYTDLGTAGAVRHIATSGQSLGQVASPAPSASIAVSDGGIVAWPFVTPPDSAGRTQTGTARRRLDGTVSSSSVWGDGGYAVAFLPSGDYRYTARVTDPAAVAQRGFNVCHPTDEDDECDVGTPANSRLTDLTLGPDGRLWVMQPEGDVARRMNSDATGFDQEVPLPVGSHPGLAALGPDGNLWIGGYGNTDGSGNTVNQIIRLTPSGVQKSYFLPAGKGPNDIAAGPDGALWFTEYRGQSIGRITTSGQYTSYPLPSAASSPGPYGIIAGADGALWFTERGTGEIGRLDPTAGGGIGGGGSGGGGGGGGGDISPPSVRLTGKTTEKLDSAVEVGVQCSDSTEDCIVTASGTVNVPGTANVYRLKGVRNRRVPKGSRATLKLKLSRKVLRRAKRARRRHRTVRATVRLVVKDAAGNSVSFKRTIKLR